MSLFFALIILGNHFQVCWSLYWVKKFWIQYKFAHLLVVSFEDKCTCRDSLFYPSRFQAHVASNDLFLSSFVFFSPIISAFFLFFLQAVIFYYLILPSTSRSFFVSYVHLTRSYDSSILYQYSSRTAAALAILVFWDTCFFIFILLFSSS